MASGIYELNHLTPGAEKCALGTKLDQIITLINELRTTAQENRTAILELIDDHATFKTVVDELKTTAGENRTAIMELIDDHATNITLTDELISDVNDIGAAVDGICAKLDADAGVTDTNYAAVHATGGSGAAIPADVTATSPATLTAGDPTAVSASSPATLTAGDPTAVSAVAVDTLPT